MNFYSETSGPNHKLFGRVAPICEAMYRAHLRALGKPLQPPTLCGAMPDWCHSIVDKLMLTIFKRMQDLAPQGKFEARNVGRMLGVALRAGIHFFKELPAQLKEEGLLDLSPEKEKKVEATIDMDAILAFASDKLNRPISNEDELGEAGAAEFEKAVKSQFETCLSIGKYLLDRPLAEQYEFLCGIPEGFALFLDGSGGFAGKSKRAELYLLLLMYWPEIAEMQKAEPPKTCRFLLEWLDEQEGEPLVADSQQFNALCGEIGLVMGPPGHPHKSDPS